MSPGLPGGQIITVAGIAARPNDDGHPREARRSGDGSMGLSFDKADGSLWLDFAIKPCANPLPEAERAAKLNPTEALRYE